MNRQQWLKARLKGIGASEAAAIVGQSPYKTNEQLWLEKTGRVIAEDISDKSYVKYGTEAEDYLRELFALDYPQYIVTYDQFGMIANNPKAPFMFATLDGELTEKTTGRKGVLEIKTTEILQSGQWAKWKDQIPQHYYIQVLHQLLATGYEFAVLKAQIKVQRDGALNIYTKHYHIERADVKEDMEHLLQEEIEFWEYVEGDRRPNLLLPQI